ncbi:alpha/beta-type small acid-soluble spore protein [Crassaminicella profunda]|uniref:alpha/beta-type small acid-soluble spore protein n=1 Tax=Crassaminicella profunda TaxID=1286698 RepID=UPI001CA721DF|nr:alpha/beta-type small acid-soluble spore protein [Crassaminicella profunda]QZY54563.1 alpha/beta-type small acid-soluble spore protein [Crassaminicella profunda]
MTKNFIDPNAVKALSQMKYEFANQLALAENFLDNKGNLSSSQNVCFGGYVGGHMTRKLVEMAEKDLINKK